MRINCHAHIFNLVSVFTSETLEIFIKRLLKKDTPPVFNEEIAKLLASRVSWTDGDTGWQGGLVDTLTRVAASEDLENQLSGMPDEMKKQFGLLKHEVLGSVRAEFLASTLRDIFRTKYDPDADTRGTNLWDILDSVAIALQPDIPGVARRLLKELEPDDVVVALMMDITSGGDADQWEFNTQTQGTMDAVLAYPGRILPFFAVNPLRNGHYGKMEEALTGQGFVGIKLYPSLGYSLQTPEMEKVFNFCADNRVPMLMHCNQGGFAVPENVKYCDPGLWREILVKDKEKRNLKICFGHFGGDDNLAADSVAENSWTRTILNLMQDHDGVYADIAYHDAPMEGGVKEDNYFRNLINLIDDPKYGDRILFGTDFFMVRVVCREKGYWEYFEQRINEGDVGRFKKITEANPAAFLGMNALAAADGWCLRNHARFIADNRTRVKAEPAKWLLDLVENNHGAVEFKYTPLLRWSEDNKVHSVLNEYVKSKLKSGVGDVTFKEMGSLPLSRLKYWDLELGPATAWENELDRFFTQMDEKLRKAGAGDERGADRGATRNKVMEALSRGDMLVAELGDMCDGFYRFQDET